MELNYIPNQCYISLLHFKINSIYEIERTLVGTASALEGVHMICHPHVMFYSLSVNLTGCVPTEESSILDELFLFHHHQAGEKIKQAESVEITTKVVTAG